ncbi:MAG: hypothetical protein Q9185_002800 [Variospora sp. 1 TL-2023]
MKSYIASAAVFAALVAAQSADQLQALQNLPECGRLCITNMLNLASSLGCSGPTDVACLCTNDDFGFGIRDCTAEACPPNADRSSVIDFGNEYCRGLASGGSGTTTAIATTGTNTVVVSTGPSTTVTASSDSGSGGAVVGGGSVVTTTDDSGSPSTTTIAPTSTDGSSTGGPLVGSNSTSSTNGTSPIVGGAPFTSGTSSTGNSPSGGAESSSGTATGTSTEGASSTSGSEGTESTSGTEGASETDTAANAESTEEGSGAHTHHVAAAGLLGFADRNKSQVNTSPQTLLLPPAFALALYLLTTYVLLPLYRKYRARHPSSAYTLLTPITDRLPANLPLPAFFGARRRGSEGSGDSLLGDEELEERFDGGGGGDGRGEDERGEERLSLELERGFKDESESEEEDGGRDGGRRMDGRR